MGGDSLSGEIITEKENDIGAFVGLQQRRNPNIYQQEAGGQAEQGIEVHTLDSKGRRSSTKDKSRERVPPSGPFIHLSQWKPHEIEGDTHPHCSQKDP